MVRGNYERSKGWLGRFMVSCAAHEGARKLAAIMAVDVVGYSYIRRKIGY
jgi:hypothetical protein